MHFRSLGADLTWLGRTGARGFSCGFEPRSFSSATALFHSCFESIILADILVPFATICLSETFVHRMQSKFRVSVCIKRISFVKFFVVSRNG